MLVVFRLTIPIFIIIALTREIATKHVKKERRSQHKGIILSDLPKRSDLAVYLRVLEKVINYGARNKELIDLNFDFGLFLLKVNLKHVLVHQKTPLPKPLLKKIKEIVAKTETLLSYFKRNALRDVDADNKKYKEIYSMFTNETDWINRIDKFESYTNSNIQVLRQIEKKYTTWDNYMKKNKHYLPSPDESDMCLASLAHNPISLTDQIPTCKVTSCCYDMIIKGSDYGYSLSHRLLILLMARFGRGCVIFSPLMDKELSRRFCTTSYAEAEFIAKNGYELADLMLEQISLCTLDGHTQFIHRSWLQGLLPFQTKHGCFGLSAHTRHKRRIINKSKPLIKNKQTRKKFENHRDRSQWQFIRSRKFKLDDVCLNGFTTGAASTLASAIRFIVYTLF